MKRIISVIGSLALVILVGGCPPPPNDITACDPQGCISENSFTQNIVSLLQAAPGVVGYSLAVSGLPAVFGGSARVSPDPSPMPMLPNGITNIESVSKMLTTFAVLHSMTEHNISLDDTIYPYLYTDWQAVASASAKKLTFRELLTQRSGFPDNLAPNGCGGANTTYATLKTYITTNYTPVSQNPIGVYSNCNFAIFRKLLPQLENNSVINAAPDNNANNAPSADLSANFYVNYVNQYVLSPSGLNFQACAPTSNVAYQMLSYPPPPTTNPTNSTDWGLDNWPLACGGGGWYMSAGSLFLVFNTLASGTLLTPAQQAQLYNTTKSPKFPGLGWDNVVANCPGANANGQTYYWCKNGGEEGAPGPGVETFAGLFKCNAVPVIVVVNSPINQNITVLVTTAFGNSKAPSGNPQPCPPSAGG